VGHLQFFQKILGCSNGVLMVFKSVLMAFSVGFISAGIDPSMVTIQQGYSEEIWNDLCHTTFQATGSLALYAGKWVSKPHPHPELGKNMQTCRSWNILRPTAPNPSDLKYL